ncbi:HPr family phosphocarrier protein [Dehalococcoidia bacterium]|nr:HPr family phosphocarrier protein [Dehalococcoidia bacterium]
MQQQSFIIQNKVGLHARPAVVLVQAVSKFKANIVIEKDGKKVSAKSILGVLSLGAEKGAKIMVEADGEDEENAIKAFEELVANNFGDEE